MYVYFLSNNKTPTVPFYVGITHYPHNRLNQHKNNWSHHKPYVENDDFSMHILFDTGNNEHNISMAEKLEENFIKYFDTIRFGSNKVLSFRLGSKRPIYKLSKESIKKGKNTRIRNLHKTTFKKILNYLEENNPFLVSNQDFIHVIGYASFGKLDKYLMQYHKKTFDEWFDEYKYRWLREHEEECVVSWKK